LGKIGFYAFQRDVGFRKISNRFWKCLCHSTPFTHTVSPVWLEKIVFTKSRLNFMRPAGNHGLWGARVNCRCKRCCG
jgi:hypothetical protein